MNIEHHPLILEALVVRNLDEDILGGTLFMAVNDVWVRPNKHLIGIGDSTYDYKGDSRKHLANVRAVTHVMKVNSSTVIFPEEVAKVTAASPVEISSNATAALVYVFI